MSGQHAEKSLFSTKRTGDPITRSHLFTFPLKISNELVILLALHVSVGGGNCLPSSDPSTRLYKYTIKKRFTYMHHFYNSLFSLLLLCQSFFMINIKLPLGTTTPR